MSAPKNQENQQFGRVSLTGEVPVAERSLAGQGRAPLLDEHGRLWVNGSIGPLPGFTTRNQLIVGATNGNGVRPIGGAVVSFLASLTGFVIKDDAESYPLYLQLFILGVDTSSVRVSIPILGDNVAFSYSPGLIGTAAGTSVALSTTPETYTAALLATQFYTQGVYWTA